MAYGAASKRFPREKSGSMLMILWTKHKRQWLDWGRMKEMETEGDGWGGGRTHKTVTPGGLQETTMLTLFLFLSFFFPTH